MRVRDMVAWKRRGIRAKPCAWIYFAEQPSVMSEVNGVGDVEVKYAGCEDKDQK